MSKKARRRPSWKNPRRWYTVSRYRITGLFGKYEKSIRLEKYKALIRKIEWV